MSNPRQLAVLVDFRDGSMETFDLPREDAVNRHDHLLVIEDVHATTHYFSLDLVSGFSLGRREQIDKRFSDQAEVRCGTVRRPD